MAAVASSGPNGPGPQMVLCGMVVNPDGTVAGAGPLGQLPPSALNGISLPPQMQNMSAMPGAGVMPNPTTIAAWGAATMMGKGTPSMPAKGGKSGKGNQAGFGMMPVQPPDALNPSLQGFMRGGKGNSRNKGRPADNAPEPDWESLRRPRQNEPNPISETSKFRELDPGFSRNAAASRGQGKYAQPFADSTTKNDWESLGRNREQSDVAVVSQGSTPLPQELPSKVKMETADGEADDQEWSGMFESTGRETSKMVDTLKDLKLKVEKPRLVEREQDKDWAQPVPEEELEWHLSAAESAKQSLKEMEPEPAPLDMAAQIALAQKQAEERFYLAKREAARESAGQSEDQKAEDLRAQQAAEAREERQRELAEIERQKARQAERQAKSQQTGGDQPKMTWSQARAMKMQQPHTATTLNEVSSAEAYRSQQAQLARQQREQELRQLEMQKQRDMEIESRVATQAPAGGS